MSEQGQGGAFGRSLSAAENLTAENFLFDVCTQTVGCMDTSFLCQSIGLLMKESPVTLRLHTSIDEAVRLLQEHRVGCLLVVDETGKLVGIFSERDFIKKVYGKLDKLDERPVTEVMTANPMSITPEGNMAYALNLMAHGGFRHIPVVDQDDMPIGIISVRDITDVIVERMTGDILAMELEEE